MKGPHRRTTRFRACDRMLPHTLWAGDKRGDCRRSSLLASVPVRLTVSAVLGGEAWLALLRAVTEHVHSHVYSMHRQAQAQALGKREQTGSMEDRKCLRQRRINEARSSCAATTMAP